MMHQSVGPSVTREIQRKLTFLDADSHLYKRVGLSVGPSVDPSVGSPVGFSVGP